MSVDRGDTPTVEVIAAAVGMFNWKQRQDVAEYVVKMLIEARTVRTVEQLNALPDGAIVQAKNGHAYERSMTFTLTGRRWLEVRHPNAPTTSPFPASFSPTPTGSVPQCLN